MKTIAKSIPLSSRSSNLSAVCSRTMTSACNLHALKRANTISKERSSPRLKLYASGTNSSGPSTIQIISLYKRIFETKAINGACSTCARARCLRGTSSTNNRFDRLFTSSPNIKTREWTTRTISLSTQSTERANGYVTSM